MGANLLGCSQIYDQTQGGEQKNQGEQVGGRKQQQYEEDAKERLGSDHHRWLDQHQPLRLTVVIAIDQSWNEQRRWV